MRGRFTLPCSTLRVHTSAQVSGTVESGDMRRREVTCSAVSGKSLARALGGPLWLERPRHRPDSPRSTRVTKVNSDRCQKRTAHTPAPARRPPAAAGSTSSAPWDQPGRPPGATRPLHSQGRAPRRRHLRQRRGTGELKVAHPYHGSASAVLTGVPAGRIDRRCRSSGLSCSSRGPPTA